MGEPLVAAGDLQQWGDRQQESEREAKNCCATAERGQTAAGEDGSQRSDVGNGMNECTNDSGQLQPATIVTTRA